MAFFGGKKEKPDPELTVESRLVKKEAAADSSIEVAVGKVEGGVLSLEQLSQLNTRSRIEQLTQQIEVGGWSGLSDLTLLIKSGIHYKVEETEGIDAAGEAVIAVVTEAVIGLAKNAQWQILDELASQDLGIFNLGLMVPLEKYLKERLDGCFLPNDAITISGIEEITKIHRCYYFKRQDLRNNFFDPYGNEKLNAAIFNGDLVTVLLLLTSNIWEFDLAKYCQLVRGLVWSFLQTSWGTTTQVTANNYLWLEKVLQETNLGSLAEESFQAARTIIRLVYRGPYDYRPEVDENVIKEIQTVIDLIQTPPRPVWREVIEKLIRTTTENCAPSNIYTRIALAEQIRREKLAADEDLKSLFIPAIELLAKQGYLQKALNMCQNCNVSAADFVDAFKQGIAKLLTRGNALDHNPEDIGSEIREVCAVCRLPEAELGRLLFASLADNGCTPEEASQKMVTIISCASHEVWEHFVGDPELFDRLLAWKKTLLARPEKEQEVALALMTAYVNTKVSVLEQDKKPEVLELRVLSNSDNAKLG
jgi:hypothetical protein